MKKNTPSWIKAKRERRKAERAQALTRGAVPLSLAAEPLEADPSVTPCDTRFTEEYREFLKKQETDGAEG